LSLSWAGKRSIVNVTTYGTGHAVELNWYIYDGYFNLGLDREDYVRDGTYYVTLGGGAGTHVGFTYFENKPFYNEGISR